MNERENVENALAGSEAREAVARRSPSSSAEAIDAAVRKHLAAEEYFVRHHREQQQKAVEPDNAVEMLEPVEDAGAGGAEERPGP
jgi:hypothetical protein